MSCNSPCNVCDLPLHNDVELEDYLNKNVVKCSVCNKRLLGAVIPCDFHGCNKNYCCECSFGTGLQCNYCLGLACCDTTLNMVKYCKAVDRNGNITDKDLYACKHCVVWLQEKYNKTKRFLDSLPPQQRNQLITNAPHLYGEFKDLYN